MKELEEALMDRTTAS